jgi:hypothetical protein
LPAGWFPLVGWCNGCRVRDQCHADRPT